MLPDEMGGSEMRVGDPEPVAAGSAQPAEVSKRARPSEQSAPVIARATRVEAANGPGLAAASDRRRLVADPALSSLEKVALNVGAFVTFDQPGSSAAVGALFSVQGWLIRHPDAPAVQFEVNGKPVAHVHFFRREDVLAEHRTYEATGFEFWVDASRMREGASTGLYVTARCGAVTVQKLYLKCSVRQAPGRTDELVYFMHIPKTAGSSVVRAIDGHRGVLSTLKVYSEVGCLPPGQLSELSSEALSGFDLVYGHFDYNLRPGDDRPRTYCAILRDPYDFVLSQYYFAKHVRKAPECVNTFSIREFLKLHPTAFENAYCRILCGDIPADAPVTEAHLERALQAIDREFFFVGVTERLHESLRRISLRLGVDIARAKEPVNVTPSSLERDNLDLEAFRRSYHELVKHDLKLYDHVLQRYFGYP